MRCAARLLHQAARITLFTRANCSLCTTAAETLKAVRQQRPFEYRVIDVMEDGHKQWKDIYEFDTPVIHVEQASAREDSNPPSDQKLMHRFTADQVSRLLSAVPDDSP